MKSLLALLITISALAGCEEKPGVNRQESGITFVTQYDINQSGMHYVLFRETHGGMVIINTTKDSLQAEYYKRQLNNQVGH